MMIMLDQSTVPEFIFKDNRLAWAERIILSYLYILAEEDVTNPTIEYLKYRCGQAGEIDFNESLKKLAEFGYVEPGTTKIAREYTTKL